MASGIFSALSGAVSNEARVETLSHNLANVNTPGFQAFKMAIAEAQGPVANPELRYAAPDQVVVDTSPGPLRATGNPLDIALSQDVFLGVRAEGQEAMVRGGTLVVAPQGQLQTAEGYAVLDETGRPIAVPEDARSVRVTPDGHVLADGEEVARLRLLRADDAAGLTHLGGRLVQSPQAVAVGDEDVVLPGYLEQANVSAVESMTKLIAAHRHYNVSLNVVDAFAKLERVSAAGFGG